MIKLEEIEVMNFRNAIRGMRNPMESWAQSDSYLDENKNFIIGPKDMELALKLVKAGSDHRKFMRQIFVSIDITAPLYWWKEMDTYKIGTVANSTSTMHKIHTKKLTDFDLYSVDKLDGMSKKIFQEYTGYIEEIRKLYVETKAKETWYQVIQMLPSNFDQMRTWTSNYEVLRNEYFSRKNHKQDEWVEFCKMIETLPYSELITTEKEK